MFKISALPTNGGRITNVYIDIEIIDSCPFCHKKINPLSVENYLCNVSVKKTKYLQRIFRCPNNECGMVFIALYEIYFYERSNSYVYSFKKLEPTRPYEPSISKIIRDKFPAFYKIYKEANAVDALGLLEVSGMVFRKSLEFLVKEFAKDGLGNLDNKKEMLNEIDRMSLASCIKKYITDPNTKSMAERTAWLGNDETHYLRKWPEKDINDLKVLLKLTINSIENQLLINKYQEEMDKPRK